MQPYIKYLKPSYKQRIGCLAFQLFLFIETDPSEENEEIDLSGLRYATNSVDWCKSDYMKMILKQTHRYCDLFQRDLHNNSLKPYYYDYFKTVRMMEHFFTPSDLEEFMVDNKALADTIVDYSVANSEKKESKKCHEKALSELHLFFNALPSQKQSFLTLLTELPFQLFVLVADADDDLDNKERIEFLRIIRDPDWCLSESARAFFNSTSYYFSDYMLLFHRGKFRKTTHLVQKTIYLLDRLFQKTEAGLIKTDLSRLINETAKASGGLGGIRSISKAEKKVIAQLTEIFGDLSYVQTSARSNINKRVASQVP